MNLKSLEKTLKRKVSLKKTSILGYQRVFNAPFGPYAFLNLEKKKGAIIDAAYFEISETELLLFTKREEGSKLIEVRRGYFAFIWPSGQCKVLPVVQSYLDVCLDGAKRLNIDFWKNTIKPITIINDRDDPKY